MADLSLQQYADIAVGLAAQAEASKIAFDRGYYRTLFIEACERAREEGEAASVESAVNPRSIDEIEALAKRIAESDRSGPV